MKIILCLPCSKMLLLYESKLLAKQFVYQSILLSYTKLFNNYIRYVKNLTDFFFFNICRISTKMTETNCQIFNSQKLVFISKKTDTIMNTTPG